MALVSKAKAAKLAGVSRTTIHRYVTDGKLSMSGDKVDTSELLRVFGSLTAPKSEQGAGHVQHSNTGQHVTTGGQGAGQAQIDLMERVIDDLRADRDNWRNKADELVELLKAEQDNIRLLTHQSPVTNKAESFAVVIVAGLAVVIVGVLVWLALA
jgi:hypothetical protein